MKLKRISLENVRSFLERQDVLLDGPISMLIGPNGGGKTNLLDACVIALRKHLLRSWSRRVQGNPLREEFYVNEQVAQLTLTRHREAPTANQVIELEIEVTEFDIQNMEAMQRDADEFNRHLITKYNRTVTFGNVAKWPSPLPFTSGDRLIFTITNDAVDGTDAPRTIFRQYLELFEVDTMLRDELGKAPLSLPLLSLPTSRSTSGFGTSVSLPGFDQFNYKRSIDVATSKSGGGLVEMALGRLAIKHRLLREEEKANAEFENDEVVRSLRQNMQRLGYDITIQCVDALRNDYSISWTKDGKSFAAGDSSSGEKEFLTYLFAIYGLKIRDALIVVDEPELHLHPKWQKALLGLFEDLAADTGNQFLLATHSPAFISPSSIQYVSRVYSTNQQSRVIRLNSTALPNPKHLFAIVNSQNNERIFFTNKVMLVEGISDRIVFERLSNTHFKGDCAPYDFEIVAVGGKGFFAAYKALLHACGVNTAIIADRDYLLNIAPADIRQLFPANPKKVGKHINSGSSRDALTLFAALETAISKNDTTELTQLWEYIKERHRDLAQPLSAPDQAKLNNFFDQAEAQGTFILRDGAIEDYLPDGYKDKNVDKLIALAEGDDFANALAPSALGELGRILLLAAA